MSAATTQALYASLRTKLLDFIPEGGATPDSLGQNLTGIYIVQGPDTVSYPYGIMRLQARQTTGEYNSERETLDLELLLYHRPRSQQYVVEGYADIADQALLRYRDTTSGLVFARERQRDTLPQGTGVGDREVVGVRLLFPLVVWPVWLTQYADL
jgi:hypothetical protein